MSAKHMSAKSRRPFYVFAVVAGICALVLVTSIRTSKAGPPSGEPTVSAESAMFDSAGRPIGRLPRLWTPACTRQCSAAPPAMGRALGPLETSAHHRRQTRTRTTNCPIPIRAIFGPAAPRAPGHPRARRPRRRRPGPVHRDTRPAGGRRQQRRVRRPERDGHTRGRAGSRRGGALGPTDEPRTPPTRVTAAWTPRRTRTRCRTRAWTTPAGPGPGAGPELVGPDQLRLHGDLRRVVGREHQVTHDLAGGAQVVGRQLRGADQLLGAGDLDPGQLGPHRCLGL